MAGVKCTGYYDDGNMVVTCGHTLADRCPDAIEARAAEITKPPTKNLLPGDFVRIVKGYAVTGGWITKEVAVLWNDAMPEDSNGKIPGDGVMVKGGSPVLVLGGPQDIPHLKKEGSKRWWFVLVGEKFGWLGDDELEVV